MTSEPAPGRSNGSSDRSPAPTEPPRDRSFREHYAPSQYRRETWNLLKNTTQKLRRDERRGVDVEELRASVDRTLSQLTRIESYWAFPGVAMCRELTGLLDGGAYDELATRTARLVRLLVGHGYRGRPLTGTQLLDASPTQAETQNDFGASEGRPYFEVLIVDDVDAQERKELRDAMLAIQGDDDEFVYDVVFAPSFEDAVIAVLFNQNIQACVLRYDFPVESQHALPELRHFLDLVPTGATARAETEPSDTLAEVICALRPELDLFKVTDETLGSVAASRTRAFRRVFYQQEDFLELHLSIQKGIRERYDTPFFFALRQYSQRPTGVFHALPISRGKSITKSHWIRDMARFYGANIFLAETSSTTGGLDSLLQPTGPLKLAQEKIARAFGSKHSYLVTNGTSTANKIVTQALVAPGDLVLLSHDCHKSHPYALVLAGAHPIYLEPYPLDEFTMFGGVSLREIKRQLVELRRAGKLDRVRMLLLTNSTFDGIVYDPERIMREVLAIKPDMIFLWDEAWFAFARATPTYRRRTSMEAASRLRREFDSEDYRTRYEEYRGEFDALDPEDDTTWLDRELLPDPEKVRIRVFATHSTHKTLTSLRQGSMIHVHDEDFERDARRPFDEAYMTHTSTSPNYQILASLDVGRRQLELEGYEFVRSSVGLAMIIRKQITDHPLLRKYFRVLRAQDMIPPEYRPSGLEGFYSADKGFTLMDRHWKEDEFALDPTRITLHVGATGMDGDTFRKLLMEEYDIQINKTSRNTILLMVNIGSTHGSATYLLDVLVQIATKLEEESRVQSDLERRRSAGKVRSLVEQLPPLPRFSRFHPAFVNDPTGGTPEGDMRRAFFLAYDADATRHLALDGSVEREMEAGGSLVSAAFVTPYPPGFPILVPGQVITRDILDYLKALDVKEIHGYDAVHGLLLFRPEALEKPTAERSLDPARQPAGGRTPSAPSARSSAPPEVQTSAPVSTPPTKGSD